MMPVDRDGGRETMSRWCTSLVFDAADYAFGPGPIVYHHSGAIPDPDDRDGVFDLAYIAGHLRGRDQYIRVGMLEPGDQHRTVVLDREQVKVIVETLQKWLATSEANR
jgi:hypothetical protein